jgi:hypothetical protein
MSKAQTAASVDAEQFITDTGNSDAAAQMPQQQAAGAAKKKKALRWVFNKAADSAGRAAVTGAMKIAVLSALAGIGASSYLAIGSTALAAGVGSAAYVYSKDLFFDWRAAKREGRAVQWWSKERSRKVKIALLTGAAGGAFGAWLAGTDTFQEALGFVKHMGGKALSAVFNHFSAPSLPAVVPAIAPPIASAADVHVHVAEMLKPAVAPKIETIVPYPVAGAPLPMPAAHDVLPVVDAAPALKPETALQKMMDAMSHSREAHGTIMNKLLHVNAADTHSVSPQFLKDRAHEILRMKDIPWAQRLEIAHQLGAEAQARGNHQAVAFMKDLAKLESGTWKPKGLGIPGVKPALHHVAAPAAHTSAVEHVVPKAHEVVLPKPMPRPEHLAVSTAPDTVTPALATPAPDANAFTAMAAPKIDVPKEPLRTLVLGADDLTPKITPDFHEAATCTISRPDPTGGFDAPCVVHAETMRAGDYVAFVARENPALRVVTPLVEGSSDVPTEGFLNAHMVADGVQKITLARAAAMKP